MPTALPTRVPRHSLFEDIQALTAGTLLVSVALLLFQQVGLLTGGTAGLAFVLHYATGWPYGVLLFAVNLPFYGFALRRMGQAFTLKTFAAITLLSLLTSTSPRWLAIEHIHPAYAAVVGGLLLGTGCLFLARHRASLGGATIVSLYLQQAHGMRAGHVQLGMDAAILLLALSVLQPAQVGYSLLAAGVMGLFLAINHRPGRYLGG